MDMAASIVDLLFPVRGATLPFDHSYPLYGALCRLQPQFHLPEHPIGVFPITGRRQEDRTLKLGSGSRLRLRLPARLIGEALPLIEAPLSLDGHTLTLGHPSIIPVPLPPRLQSRWVTFGGAQDAEQVLQRARKQLAKMEIASELILLPSARPGHTYQRRTRRIRDVQIVGYAMLVEGLTAQGALQLCLNGLGGRRHFGGGLFLPTRSR